mgnify:FL=1
MPTIQVLLEVPSEIMKGLESGQYVRDAAGIIRWSKGTEKAGEIVAHLKEITDMEWSPAQPVGPNLLIPMGALMAVQVAGFVYLGYQLNQIRRAIESLQQDVTKILTNVEMIREQQWLDRLDRVAHGVEHLLDSYFRPNLLEESRNSFREARAEIKLFLQNQEPMALVEYLPQTEQLVRGLCVSFVGEYVCLQKQNAEFLEMAHICDRYSGILSDTSRRLSEAPPISRIIPSQRYFSNFHGRRKLQERIDRTQRTISDERSFVEILDKVDRDRLSEMRGALPPEAEKAVMVVYP